MGKHTNELKVQFQALAEVGDPEIAERLREDHAGYVRFIAGVIRKGELYLISSYYCHGKAKTNEIVAGHEGRTSVLFDVPNEISPTSPRYVMAQLKDIAPKLEEITGQRLDPDMLKEAVWSSNRARSSLLKINELMKAERRPVITKTPPSASSAMP